MEKTQSQIKFENVHQDRLGGFCHEAPYKSLGNVLNMLYAYRLQEYDTCTVGNNIVNGRKGMIATFEFNDTLQMPIFTFTTEYSYLNDLQDNYLNMINTEYGKDYQEYLNKLWNKFKI